MKILKSAKKAAARKPAANRAVKKTTKSATPKLNKGEVYLGVVCKDGKLAKAQHIILLPGDKGDVKWADAVAWAKENGGTLPTRMELLLMFQTQRKRFQERAYWSGETYAGNESYAWTQYFSFGYQDLWTRDDESRAVAVRRLPIQ